jgi:hypothetical protein
MRYFRSLFDNKSRDELELKRQMSSFFDFQTRSDQHLLIQNGSFFVLLEKLTSKYCSRVHLFSDDTSVSFGLFVQIVLLFPFVFVLFTTFVWCLSIRALVQLYEDGETTAHCKPISKHVLNPKAITMHELYGAFNEGQVCPSDPTFVCKTRLTRYIDLHTNTLTYSTFREK